MKQIQEQLIESLLAKNSHFNYNLARTWVELMWDDVATTHAKANYANLSDDRIAAVLRSWIDGHGERLHEFIAKNPLYKDHFKDNHLAH